MAKKVVLIDDVSGETIDDTLGGGTVRFSVEGKNYAIDLGVKNTEAFHKDLEKWIAHAAEEGGSTRGRPRGSGAGKGATASGRPKEELQAIREWAGKNGFEVSPRGRVKADIIDAFDKAHAGE